VFLTNERQDKMLICEICTCTTEILAHQVRAHSILAVCLDCADRYYQNQLTKSLIESEMVGA
jgi:ribosome-binding protein aMBF1 (putative translation factor)